MRTRILMTISLGVVVVFPQMAWGAVAEILDQAQEMTGDSYAFYQPQGCPSAGVKGAAQTFTAGLSGLLTRVDLFLSKENWTTDAEHMGIEIRAVDPNGSLLASSSIVLASAIPFEPNYSWVSFTFAAPTTVSAGQVYAIVLPPDEAQNDDYDPTYRWPGPYDDVYAGGVTWDKYCNSSGEYPWQSYDFGSDRTFRTYVSPIVPTKDGTWGRLRATYH